MAKWFVVLLVLGLAGCGPTYRSKFMDQAKEKGWTQDQAQAAYYYSFRIYFSKQNPNQDGFTVMYGKLDKKEVREKLETFAKFLNDILSYKDEEAARYIQAFNLRQGLEHDEEVNDELIARVRADELDTQFKDYMGELSPDEDEMAKSFSLKKIFVDDPVKAFPFSSLRIEEARKRGVLQEIGHVNLDVYDQFNHKDKDPAHLDDPNQFIWKSKRVAMKVVSYKIMNNEKPHEGSADYVEGYRLNEKGVPESRPALRIFLIDDHKVAVLVIDTHREGKDPGFGLPDIVERIQNEQYAQDLLSRKDLLAKLFDEHEKDGRVPPTEPEFRVEIARLGEPIENWEKATDPKGWVVPLSYKNRKGDNYNIRIRYAKEHHESDEAPSDFHRIEYIAKEYTNGTRYTPSDGAVMEYYRPKPDVAREVQAEILEGEDTQKVSFVFEDGDEVVGRILPGKNKFIEDEPYAIAYTDGEKRFWIEKGKGSPIFDRRKEMYAPKGNNVGTYEKDEEMGILSPSHRSSRSTLKKETPDINKPRN